MNIPKISVIVATYNVEAYIAEAMDCLLGQTLAPYEILVINDGSTDGTLALLESRYGDNELVKIISQTNQGVGAVRKLGFDRATGDYLFFCDPDDAISLELFAEFAAALQANPGLELFYFSSRMFKDSAQGREFLRRDTAAPREGVYARGVDLLEDLILAGKYKAATWQYIFKRAMADRFEVRFDGVAHEDHLFSMRVYVHSGLSYAVRGDRYFQRVRAGSLTNSIKDERYVHTHYDAYRWTIEEFKQHRAAFAQAQEVARTYMRLGVKLALQGAVKHRVRTPAGLFALTRQDAKVFGLGMRGGLTLMAPWLAFLRLKLRFEMRALGRWVRGGLWLRIGARS